MSARFVAASSQRFLNTAPAVTTFPFTVAMWVRPLAANCVMWTLGNAGTSNRYIHVSHVAGVSGYWSLAANAGGGDALANTATPPVAGAWHFVLWRCQSSALRRISVINADGSISHASSGTARNPTMNTMAIGVRYNAGAYSQYMDGDIAEYWITNTEIQGLGAQLQDSTLRQLAYRGPFSIPHVANDIVEYRSYRRLLSSQDISEEVYWRGTRPVWTNTNGVALGRHPPYADNYDPPAIYMPPMVLV